MKTVNRQKYQLQNNMMLTTLGPDHCELHIQEVPSETVVKAEQSHDSAAIDEEVNVIKEEYDAENITDNFDNVPLRYENSFLQCTKCLKEIVNEHAYIQHKCIQMGVDDGDCGTSRVSKPHRAVEPGTSHSALFSESLMSTNSENKVQVKEADSVETTIQVSKSNYVYLARLNEVYGTANTIERKKDTINVFNQVNTALCSNNENNESSLLIKKKIFSCEGCSKQFLRKSGLVTHTKFHTPVNPAICNICPFKSKFTCTLKVLMQSHKLDKANKEDRFKKNIKTHASNKPYSCESCNYKTARKNHLKQHMQTHSTIKPLSCNVCDYKCIRNTHLAQHMWTHSGKMPYHCAICDYKNTRKHRLVSHMKKHNGEMPFNCEFCEYKCDTNTSLVIHMKKHTDRGRYSCNLCGYKFIDKSNLVRHMKLHSGEKPFSCKLCKYTCARKHHLMRHIRTHTGEKPYSCTVCKYICAQSDQLSTHMKTHTGEKVRPRSREKSYCCKYCAYKCVSNWTLDQHMRTHTGERPFSCGVCEYKFVRRSALVRHLRLHTGEKPYHCDLCSHKSVQKTGLIQHLKTHTDKH